MAENNTEETYENLYVPMDGGQNYDRGDFVKGAGDLFDLEGYLEKLVKDSRNPDALSDLGLLLRNNPGFYHEQDPIVSRTESDRAYSHGVEAMSQYVKRNLNDFLGLCDDGHIVGYATSVPIYRTGNKEHDDFVDSLNEVKRIGEIAKSGDPGKAREYVQGKLENVPQWLKEAFGILSGDSDYIQALFQEFAGYDQAKFTRMIQDESGKVKRGFLEGVIKNSLKKAWKEHDKAHERDKNDVYKGDIRPLYIELARLVYTKEKAAEKKGKDSARIKRRVERAEIGMSQ